MTNLEADALNVYKPHTPLRAIIIDGWMRNFKPAQTIREASNAGFARCVVEPLLDRTWKQLTDEYNSRALQQWEVAGTCH